MNIEEEYQKVIKGLKALDIPADDWKWYAEFLMHRIAIHNDHTYYDMIVEAGQKNP
jgi:hypothetical protein